jgi:hypothetical protein
VWGWVGVAAVMVPFIVAEGVWSWPAWERRHILAAVGCVELSTCFEILPM